MNIDDLKGAWSEDEFAGVKLPVSTAVLGKTTSAVSRIRRNMKAEFIGLLISYAALTALLLYDIKSPLLFNISCVLIFIVLGLTSFYYSRFYFFYKSISRYDLNMKNNINKMAYELELNVEIYKTFNFCIVPLASLVGFTLLCGENGLHFMQRVLTTDIFVTPASLLLVLATIAISFIITYLCVIHHVRVQYGKYLTELKQIKDDLEDER